MNKIAPQDMRQHLMLNQSRLSTAEEVAQEIENYWDATEEFSLDDKNQAGFIAPVGEGPAKGGKPNGVPYNFDKGSGTKGKGKIHKGLGFQPERGEQRKFGNSGTASGISRSRLNEIQDRSWTGSRVDAGWYDTVHGSSTISK